MRICSIPLLLTSCLLLNGCKQVNPNKDAWLSDPHGHFSIATTDDPQSLDPRFARDIPTVNAVNNLYEGLLRKQEDHTFTPAVAASFDISEDQLTYTFKLRDAKWSNGDKITAQHFTESWKSQLAPNSNMPNSNQLYVIKNGRSVHEGKLPVDQLGIETPDEATIIVHLETPVPYFKELVSSHFFLPVHPQSTPDALISNGVFKLESWKKNNEITGVKNPEYWDIKNVNLQKFSFIVLDDRTALQMYEADQIDWAGSPLAFLPQDAILTLKRKQQLYTVPSAGTYWLRVNTTKSVLANVKFRQALAYAINRTALVKNVVQGNQLAALSVVPPSMGLGENEYFADADNTKAWELFEEALKELKLSIDEFPTITLLYSTASERNQKIAQAVQAQWKKVFGDKFELKGNETKSVFQQLSQMDYDIALGSWFADIDDPSNFLDIFTKKTNVGNNTGWENEEYRVEMEKSLLAKTPEERNILLQKAQEILVNDMPVIPLFFGAFNYVKKRDVSGIVLSNLGHIDLKHAYRDIGDVNELEVME